MKKICDEDVCNLYGTFFLNAKGEWQLDIETNAKFPLASFIIKEMKKVQMFKVCLHTLINKGMLAYLFYRMQLLQTENTTNLQKLN